MRTLNYILSIIFVIVVSCDHINNDNNSNLIPEDSVSQSIKKPTSDSIISSVIDSLRADNSQYFIYACENLFDYSSLLIESKYITTDFLKNNIKVNSFNGNKLIAIYYEEWSTLGKSIKLFLFNNELKKLGEGILESCHYHYGKIQIMDWNNDSIDEIQYRIDIPTQSVPYIEYIEDIYRFNESYTLENIFRISLETRDCAPSSMENGKVTERRYLFINPDEIKVKEIVYSIDCKDFSFHERIDYKQKSDSNEYTMIWSKANNTFKKQ